MENSEKRERTWYEKVFDSTDLRSSTPALKTYYDVDKFPKWVVKILAELMSQNMPAIPIKQLRVVTPEKVGRSLGQKCANFYAISERIQIGVNDPKIAAKNLELFNQLESKKNIPGVSSFLHVANVLTLQINELQKLAGRMEKNVIQAFKKALDQPSHQEAVDFFRGFAKGLSMKGLTSKGSARRTTATPIYLNMFFHWQEVDRLASVPALRVFLLQNGLTESVIGDISRLRRLCTRIGYAPGKRGRPARSKK